jgi:UDP-N-acetylglucosamine:LPS N-acetylglucosamine transferase
VPTSTHRLVGRFAAASAVPFEGTPLPRPVVTGNPVRPEILAVDATPAGRTAARKRLGLPEDEGTVVVAAVGGSLGARTINEAVLGLVGRWDGAPIAIRHAVGERDWDWAQANTPDPAPGVVAYQPVPYEDRMPDLLAACDLVVSRSGGSVAELSVIGRASVLVPLPIAPYDHQAHNAQQLVQAGAAIMLRDHELTTDRLVRELHALLDGGPAKVRAMGDAARTLGRPDAADAVAAVIEANAKSTVPRRSGA